MLEQESKAGIHFEEHHLIDSSSVPFEERWLPTPWLDTDVYYELCNQYNQEFIMAVEQMLEQREYSPQDTIV